ncbi:MULTISPECIES: hypothetical protein [Citrobacter freundii complex]|uniref:hypothetical protein n=1 Tax=Citrobacter freundii complex TaxID=1344959 RepID=UPI00257520A4|nr:hypothetical protein [Citrobacter sp. Cpo035]MDM2915091.1 hypothetical protein [Citrobacter sp. Cpo035]
MTTNHPAHGPVSLDRLHQIREILSKASAQSDGGNLGYAMADAVKVIDGAIAAFGAEPVGEVVLGEYDDCGRHPDARLVCIAADGQADWENFKDGTLLYSVTPAPLSIDERAAFNAWNNEDNLPIAGVGAKNAAWLAWQARAAMLKGAEPVTTAYKLPAEAAYGYFAFNDHHGEDFFKNREDAIAFCKEAIEEYRQENAEEGCDPDEVRRTCWGIIMQEGTDFEVDNEGHIDYALTPELAGNSPVTPDGWQLVPKEPTEAMNKAGWAAMNEHDAINPTYRAMLAAAPQQEVKSALEHGMQRYAGAMQKLADAGD